MHKAMVNSREKAKESAHTHERSRKNKVLKLIQADITSPSKDETFGGTTDDAASGLMSAKYLTERKNGLLVRPRFDSAPREPEDPLISP